MRPLRVVDLFTGIGGMALGLQRTRGFEIVQMCEILPERASVLRHHWPHVPILGDVHRVKPRDLLPCDWIVGGPPCHRTSIAASIHGYWTGESLWPEMFRLVRAIKPRGVIVEQPNRHEVWKKTVHRDLERSGYEVSRFIIEAKAVGAPHSRERVFFVAHRYGKRLALPREKRPPEIEAYKRAASTGSHWSKIKPGVLRMDDGLPAGVDRRHGSRKWRIKAAGSSCVPQVAQVLGMIILGAFSAKRP